MLLRLRVEARPANEAASALLLVLALSVPAPSSRGSKQLTRCLPPAGASAGMPALLPALQRQTRVAASDQLWPRALPRSYRAP